VTETPKRNYSLPAETGVIRVTPFGFYHRARDFVEAAELLRQQTERFSPIAAFLFCRASELALKAFLLARGDSLDQVKALGHDLTRALTDSYARGIDSAVALDPADRQMLLDVNDDYVGHKLAYFDVAWSVGPRSPAQDLESLGGVARKLVEGVERGCREAVDGEWKPFT
jgi:HEPN domain-containing protein